MKLSFNFSLLFAFILLFSCSNDKISPAVFQVTPQKIVAVPSQLNEISGIIFQNDTTLLAHNDSGNSPSIYELSLNEKRINRSVKISNALNLDWEDITQDQQYIYIADSGNNLGHRTDLKILRIAKNNLFSNDSIEADFITYDYEDQTDFNQTNSHNFDCEGITNLNNQLFLFSKNRADFKTKIYSLPKEIGDHSAKIENEFEVNGLITGATINNSNDVIALLGYNETGGSFEPFIWLFYEFTSIDFFNGKNKKLELTFDGQMEAITFGRNDNLYLSKESEAGNEEQFIYHLTIDEYLN